MAELETLRVHWLGKFDGRAVLINASDFDPKIHEVAPVAADPSTVPEPVAEEVVADATPKRKAKGK